MAFKPTRRRNGQHMVTLRLEFHVSREEVLDTIITEFYESGQDVTKGQVEEAVRSAFKSHGNEWQITAGDMRQEMDDPDAAADWAEEQLARLYPNWTN